jgi:hypothetical protein
VLNAIHPLLTKNDAGPTVELAKRLGDLNTIDGDALHVFCERFLIDLDGERERLRLLSIESTWRARDDE